MSGITYRSLGFLVAFCGVSFFATQAFAATLTLSSAHPTVSAGDVFDVSLTAYSDACFNATDLTISYDPTQVQFVSSSEEGSVFSMWLKKPEQVGLDQVSLVAGIMNGFCDSSDAHITTLMFEALDGFTGTTFSIDSGDLHAHDGRGTALNAALSDVTIEVGVSGPVDLWNEALVEDVAKPVIDTVVVGTTDKLYPGNVLIAISATDEGVGVNHFEIRETATVSEHTLNAVWRPFVGFALLIDQLFTSLVELRAVDKAGNTSDVLTITPEVAQQLGGG